MAVNTITLTPGTLAKAEDVEAKVNPLYTDIDNSNIAASAGIVFSKLDSVTVAGVTATQTLTNKTLTSPIITTPTINGDSYINGVLTVKAASATDTILQIDPFTSGSRFRVFVPATGNKADLSLSTTPFLTLVISGGQNALVVNEDGLDVDFRVETDTISNAIFVDGNANTVAFNAPTTCANTFTVIAASAVDSTLTISPFTSGNSFKASVPATGNRCTMSIGTVAMVDFQSSEVVVNEDGRTDVDFRVETDTLTNAIFVDASANTTLLGATTTAQTGFSVQAQSAIDSIFYVRPATSGDPFSITVGATGNRATFNIGGGIPLVDFFSTSGVVFNEDGLSTVDFRVETDTNANALLIDASADEITTNVLVSMSRSFSNAGDSFVLRVSGENTGAGGVSGIAFTTTGGTLDYLFSILNGYVNGAALGAYQGKVPVTIPGVGTYYIPIYA